MTGSEAFRLAPRAMNAEQRVLLFTPTGRDAELLATALQGAQVDCVRTDSWIALEKQIEEGAAAVILAEETLQPAAVMHLRMLLKAQPAWSDLPILLLTGRGADSPVIHNASLAMGNVTLLERPTRVTALVSATRAALRARARQYENRSQLTQLRRVAAELSASDQLSLFSWRCSGNTGDCNPPFEGSSPSRHLFPPRSSTGRAFGYEPRGCRFNSCLGDAPS